MTLIKRAFKLYKFAKKKGLRSENYRQIVEEMQIYQSETDQEDLDQSSQLMQSISSEMKKDKEVISCSEARSEEQTPVKKDRPEQ